MRLMFSSVILNLLKRLSVIMIKCEKIRFEAENIMHIKYGIIN